MRSVVENTINGVNKERSQFSVSVLRYSLPHKLSPLTAPPSMRSRNSLIELILELFYLEYCLKLLKLKI